MAVTLIAPAAFALKGLTDLMIAQMQRDSEEMQIVFDPELSVETSVREIRSVRKAGASLPVLPGDTTRQHTFPLLGFNYTQLQRNEYFQKRGVIKNVYRIEGDGAHQKNVYTVDGYFDFSFSLFMNDLIKLDLYEASYLAEARFANIKNFTVTLPNPIGPVTYHVDWGTIDQKVAQKTPIEFCAFNAVARVWGLFAVYEVTPNLLVDHIILDVRNWTAENILFRIKTDRGPPHTQTIQDGNNIPPEEYDIPPEEYDIPEPGVFEP